MRLHVPQHNSKPAPQGPNQRKTSNAGLHRLSLAFYRYPDAVPSRAAHDTIPIAEAARLLRGLVQPVLSPRCNCRDTPALDCLQALGIKRYTLGIAMNVIRFSGLIGDGVGRYVELHVPGRNEIPQAPPDWPITLQKGSLNVRINSDGYPSLFAELGLPNSVRSLDKNPFPPAFEIAQHEFGNNQLRPEPSMPHKGSAQVWRATLKSGEQHHACWVLRRYGSQV